MSSDVQDPAFSVDPARVLSSLSPQVRPTVCVSLHSRLGCLSVQRQAEAVQSGPSPGRHRSVLKKSGYKK